MHEQSLTRSVSCQQTVRLRVLCVWEERRERERAWGLFEELTSRSSGSSGSSRSSCSSVSFLFQFSVREGGARWVSPLLAPFFRLSHFSLRPISPASCGSPKSTLLLPRQVFSPNELYRRGMLCWEMAQPYVKFLKDANAIMSWGSPWRRWGFFHLLRAEAIILFYFISTCCFSCGAME